MPMSEAFEQRMCARLPEVVNHFGTPFHFYDQKGTEGNGRRLKDIFFPVEKTWGWQEFFAVKANPNPKVLEIMLKMEFGFDCSSIPELILAREVGASPAQTMFTSNNTAFEEFQEALYHGGCILNLDDITFVDKVPDPFPELICFRYNPGEEREGGAFIGKANEQKYGIRHDQIVEAYHLALNRGASRFGLHTMICSNELDYEYMVETVRMLLSIIEEVSETLGIIFEFINIGGGMGIPYHPGEEPFDFESFATETYRLFEKFEEKQGYAPKLFMESGRAMIGPYGVLVTRVINRMSKHREYVGVDACMSSLMRPAMYRAYHHITVYNPDGTPKSTTPVTVDVVGSLCENNDKFAIQRQIPEVEPGDILVIHDTGAHGHAMGFNYNGRLRPQELLLRPDGSVELIRRAQTIQDYLRTTKDFEADVLPV